MAQAAQFQMKAVSPKYQHLLIDLDYNHGKLTNTMGVTEPTTSSEGGFTTVQIDSTNKSQDRTTEQSLESSLALFPFLN